MYFSRPDFSGTNERLFFTLEFEESRVRHLIYANVHRFALRLNS